MSRIAGRFGRVYIALASGGTAEPLNFVAKWSLDFSTPKFDMTAMGDTNQVSGSGLPAAKGSFSGFYDNATVQTYTAATDGVARRFYLYPDLGTATQYWFGTIFPDMKIDGDVAGPVSMAAAWEAASPVVKVG